MCRYFFVKKRKGLSVWNTARILCSFHTMINTRLPPKRKINNKTDYLVFYLIPTDDNYTNARVDISAVQFGLLAPYSIQVVLRYIFVLRTHLSSFQYETLKSVLNLFSGSDIVNILVWFPSSERSFFISGLKLRGSYPSLAELLNKQNRN